MTTATTSPHDAASLTKIAEAVARAVGEKIREIRAQGVEVADTKSSSADVVTYADRAAEELAKSMLIDARPEDGIYGEEGADLTGSTGITWVVDPIDGTVNYLYDLAIYAVSIAATVSDGAPGTMADGRRAIAGAVYLPVYEKMFSAWEGGGAHMNGEKLDGPAEKELSVTLLGTGFGYTVERRTEQAEVVRQIIPQVRDIRRMGSAAADLCMLAAGRIDAYYERGLQPWDYAAGALIAREAGVLLLGMHGELPGEPMLVAAAPKLAATLHDAVSAAYENSASTGPRAK